MFSDLNCDLRTMTNGTRDSERLELIVRTQNVILRVPPSIVSDSLVLFVSCSLEEEFSSVTGNTLTKLSVYNGTTW